MARRIAERVHAGVDPEAPVFRGDDGLLRGGAQVGERDPSRTRRVAGAHLAQEGAVAIDEAQRLAVPRRAHELGGKRREGGGHGQRRRQEDRQGEHGRRDPEDAPLHRALTTNVAPAVLPKVSGSYMHSARVGGTTNVPWVVARARYR